MLDALFSSFWNWLGAAIMLVIVFGGLSRLRLVTIEYITNNVYHHYYQQDDFDDDRNDGDLPDNYRHN